MYGGEGREGRKGKREDGLTRAELTPFALPSFVRVCSGFYSVFADAEALQKYAVSEEHVK